MKILVPTDFSELSLKAVNVADKWASLFGGTVHLFHSHIPVTELDEPYSMGMSSSVYNSFEDVENSIRERLQELAEENVSSDHRGDVIVAMGNPAQAIVNEAEEYDLIVLSTHGRTGFRRFLLGSVAEKVLRMTPVPVLVVEDESNVGNFEKILVTTDFSDNADAAFPKALKIAQKSGGTVTLLHVISLEQFEDEEASPSLKKIREQRIKLIEKEYFHELQDRVQTKIIVYGGSPHEAIFNHVKENEYNLVVMSTVGRTGLDYLMMGSTTANVVRNVDTAVLSIRPDRRESSEPDEE